MVARLYSSDELEERLVKWGDWARSPLIGSVNGSAGYMRERLDRGADSAEMTGEIAITERAVARAKLQEKAYWRVIARTYMDDLSPAEIASFFHVSEDSIVRLMAEAKACVQNHIYDIERGR